MFTRTLFSIGVSTLKLKGMDNDPLCEYVKQNVNNKDRQVQKTDVELSCLNSIVLEQTQKILDKIISNPNVNNLKTKIKRVWVNHNLNKDISVTHAHRDSFLSVVYYPKSEDGRIHFYVPFADSFLSHVPVHHALEYNEYNSSSWNIEVKTGSLIIFNSILPHCALPSNKERMSIVYDIVVEET